MTITLQDKTIDYTSMKLTVRSSWLTIRNLSFLDQGRPKKQLKLLSLSAAMGKSRNGSDNSDIDHKYNYQSNENQPHSPSEVSSNLQTIFA